MESELTKAQQQTLELLTKNSLRAAEEIKVLKEVIEAQHKEIQELKKDLRAFVAFHDMEKEYQAVIKGNKSSRKYESRSNWRNGRLNPEEEQKRNQRENVYRQLVYRLRERLGERYPLKSPYPNFQLSWEEVVKDMMKQIGIE